MTAMALAGERRLRLAKDCAVAGVAVFHEGVAEPFPLIRFVDAALFDGVVAKTGELRGAPAAFLARDGGVEVWPLPDRDYECEVTEE